jgi:hypothetical protein
VLLMSVDESAKGVLECESSPTKRPAADCSRQ